MREGTTGVLNIAATCATAGIIVGVVTLTGLAQRFADIIIGYAQGSLLLTALYTAAIVWVIGLAVPVTASYIMAAVIAAPALIKLGVPNYAAHSRPTPSSSRGRRGMKKEWVEKIKQYASRDQDAMARGLAETALKKRQAAQEVGRVFTTIQ